MKLREDHEYEDLIVNPKTKVKAGQPNQEANEEKKCPEWKTMLEESHKKLQEMESQKLIRRSTRKETNAAAGGAAGVRPRPSLGGAGKAGIDTAGLMKAS